jgi:glycosyltransferase involved in cell wall biosynthesis
MLNNKTIVVVLPAYNAGQTLIKTFQAIPKDIVDHVLLVDDKSSDNTVILAKELGIQYVIQHDKNLGYGANQKTCYRESMKLNPDIIIMLHPDFQYPPSLIPAMCSVIAYNNYKVVLGSRILGKGAMQGGMPLYKYVANRILTFIQNILVNQKLSEYHTGFRAYAIDVIREIDFDNNSDDFIFDNEILCQLLMNGHNICEITCPTHYTKESSSIGFIQSVGYGFGVLRVSFQFLLHKSGLWKFKLFNRP